MKPSWQRVKIGSWKLTLKLFGLLLHLASISSTVECVRVSSQTLPNQEKWIKHWFCVWNECWTSFTYSIIKCFSVCFVPKYGRLSLVSQPNNYFSIRFIIKKFYFRIIICYEPLIDLCERPICVRYSPTFSIHSRTESIISCGSISTHL